MSQKYHGWSGGRRGAGKAPKRIYLGPRRHVPICHFPPPENFPPASKRGLFVFVPSRICLAIHPSIEGKKKWTKSVRIVVTPTELLMNHFLNSPFPAETRSETGWLPVSCVADVRRGDNMAARSSMRTSSWKTVFAYDRSILPPPCPRSSFVHVFSPLPPPPSLSLLSLSRVFTYLRACC